MCWLLKFWRLRYRERIRRVSACLSFTWLVCHVCWRKSTRGLWISFESIVTDCLPWTTFQRIAAHAEAGWRIQDNCIRSTYHCAGQVHDFYLWHDGHQGTGDIVNAAVDFYAKFIPWHYLYWHILSSNSYLILVKDERWTRTSIRIAFVVSIGQRFLARSPRVLYIEVKGQA